MSTKSGTNAFHGNGVYMLRHESLDANTFANNAQNIDKRPFRVDDAGGSIGGPILRNKLFFFSSYHGLRNNQTTTALMTVPTALERVGNFSQTLKPDENGNPIPARIFDPFNVTQKAPTSTAAPRSRTRPSRTRIRTRCGCSATTRMPNRTPDDVYNTNNFESTTTTTVRRHSNNNRVDLKLGSHSIYGSGGISYAEIITPRPFGTAPFNDAPGIRSDKNPYIQLGDAIVLTPSLVADIRYGLSRINTKNLSGNKTGFDDYASPSASPRTCVPLILFPGTAPNVNPNGYGGGGGGGSNWTALTTGNFNTKREYQTSHSITGSITKIRGKWAHKGGMEFRNLMSNYCRSRAGLGRDAVAVRAPGRQLQLPVRRRPAATSRPRRTTNAQRGVNAAGMLLGTGVWWIRPGANVDPAFAQKYFAVYSQNDWRPTAKLTVNLGLRWEVQPGPTDRFNRMSSWDFTAENSFGSMGAIAFPGEDGYSRNLWDTTYDNWGPRVGATYQLNENMVVRGGFGITYLPTQHRLLLGSDRLRLRQLLGRRNADRVRHQPGRRASHPVLRSGAAGAGDWRRREQPRRLWHRRGALRSSPQERPGAAVELLRRARARQPLDGVDRLQRLGEPQPAQPVVPDPEPAEHRPATLLSQWRDQYIASNGTLNPSTQLVQNPCSRRLVRWCRSPECSASARSSARTRYFPYPMLVGSNAAVNLSQATADYHAMLLRVNRRFSNGFLIDVNYTWSKNIDNTDTVEDNQGFNAGASARGANHYLYDLDKNRRIGYSDIPHRFVGTFLYELPFGKGKPFGSENALSARSPAAGSSAARSSGRPASRSPSPARATAPPWRVRIACRVWTSCCRRISGAGTTASRRVTLPSGRVITPPTGPT